MNYIRVLLVEDDPDWVKAITVFLSMEQDMLVVGSAVTSDEAIRLAQTLEFDIVLMDIQLDGSRLDGIHTAVEMMELHPARVIMLTSLQDEQTMTRSFTAGAVNYIEKSNFKELPHAIRAAFRYPAAMDALLKELTRLQREEQLSELTVAEREIFELMEAGYTQSQMTEKLYKAESTLKNQVNKILKKLGVQSRKEAVDKVRRKGLYPGKNDH